MAGKQGTSSILINSHQISSIVVDFHQLSSNLLPRRSGTKAMSRPAMRTPACLAQIASMQALMTDFQYRRPSKGVLTSDIFLQRLARTVGFLWPHKYLWKPASWGCCGMRRGVRRELVMNAATNLIKSHVISRAHIDQYKGGSSPPPPSFSLVYPHVLSFLLANLTLDTQGKFALTSKCLNFEKEFLTLCWSFMSFKKSLLCANRQRLLTLQSSLSRRVDSGE